MSDDQLRAAFNAHLRNQGPRDRSACPTPEQLLTLAESGQGGRSTNLQMMDHVFGCAYCRADFALLRSVQVGVQEGVQMGAPESQRADGTPARKHRTWFTGTRIAIAASLLFAIGIGSESLRRLRASEVRNMSDETDVVIVSPAASATIAPDAAFIWRRVAGAVTYEVQLLDTAGVVVTTHVTADTMFTASVDDRARIAALKSFDWFVSARRSDGNERHSAITRVQVKASGQP